MIFKYPIPRSLLVTLVLFSFTIGSAWAEHRYEVEYTVHGKNRQETVYEVVSNGRRPIQTRVYLGNKLTQAAFLTKDQDWQYGSLEEKRILDEISRIDSQGPKRVEVSEQRQPIDLPFDESNYSWKDVQFATNLKEVMDELKAGKTIKLKKTKLTASLRQCQTQLSQAREALTKVTPSVSAADLKRQLDKIFTHSEKFVSEDAPAHGAN